MAGGKLSGARLPAPGLRARLGLVALALTVIPWAGYSYVRSMEAMLRENQEQQLIATARGVATALQDRPGIMTANPSSATAAEHARLLIAGLARPGLRIWVVDNRLQLVAVAGDLKGPPPVAAGSVTFGPLEKLVHAALQPLFERLFPPPAPATEEFIPSDVVFGGPELERALDGSPAWRRRPAPGGRAVIISVAHPVWAGEGVAGAVVVEEDTDAIVTLRNRAFEQLTAVTLIAFAAAALVLLYYASRLSWRLKRLRDEAENALDSKGRVRALVAGEHARDEIGDLSRSFSTVLARLSQYNDYLEQLAGRLTHELRTPIAVVRSSLDNLRLAHAPAGDAGVYLTRAENGLRRLETILTRMAEATRLEQIVRAGERERFDATAVLAGCVEGYAAAYPGRRFALRAGDEAIRLTGAPDLFAQMLDKLAANAADFAAADSDIEISLARAGNAALLRFANKGPLLPSRMQDRLFESMVTVRRDRGGDEPHLGLGLYIVRQIAEFHGGTVRAANLADGSGVEFVLRFPLFTI